MARKKNAVRADGRIPVQVYLGRGEDGKRKYKTVYGYTQKEADAEAEKVKLAMRKGLDIMAEKDTFKDWSAYWIKLKASEVSKGQMAAYESAAKYLVEYLGDSSISKIKPADIQTVIIDLANMNPNTKRKSSKQTLRIIKIAASQIFQLAIENRVMDYNPTTAVKIPSDAPASTRRALSEEEQRWIRDTAHDAKRAAMIMMYAGLRRGELIPLTWNDIDMENCTISVNKSVEKVKGGFIIKDSAKTASGLRTVDVPQCLVDYLKTQKRESIYVCVNSKKKMHTESSWKRMWESYQSELNIINGGFDAKTFEIVTKKGETKSKKYKSKFDPAGVPFLIPKITPHWLRHTFATMLYFAGVDIITAKEQLGHSDIKTTLDIYTHLDRQHKRKEIDKLNEYLAHASQMQVN